MKTVSKYEASNLAAKAIQVIAARYSLPQLAHATVFEVNASPDNPPSGFVFRAESTEVPTGQLAGFVSDLGIEATATWVDEDRNMVIDVRFHYRHIGGGNNGYDTRFVALVGSKYDSPVFQTLMLMSDYREVHQRAWREFEAFADNSAK